MKVKCEVPGCTLYARYGVEKGKPLRCNLHRLDGDFDVLSRTCEQCNQRPTFGLPRTKTYRWCGKHAPSDAINLMTKLCQYEGCGKVPSYGQKGERPKWCLTHKNSDDVDVLHKMCEYPNCPKRAIFNNDGSKKYRWCGDHKEEGSINLMNKICQYPECKIQAHFGKRGSKTAKWCATHKENGDMDVRVKFCEHFGCETRPCFGYENEGKRRWCKEHHPEDAINLMKITCQDPNCDVTASFGDPITRERIWCAIHRKETDISLVGKRCEHTGCKKTALFGEDGTKDGKWCLDHKDRKDVNVKNKKCDYTNCVSQPKFGLPGYHPSKCGKHKIDGMMLRPSRKCVHEGCRNIAIYSIPKSNDVQAHCDDHKIEGSINVVERSCVKCTMVHRLDPKTNMCTDCHTYTLNSDGTKTATRMAKQREVRAYLNEQKLYESSYDQRITFRCGQMEKLYRPDFVFHFKDVLIIVEIDEYQHKHYDFLCEISRMSELDRMFKISEPDVTKIVFIRYNPDEFNCRVKPTHENRLKYLKKVITDKYVPGPTEVIYLFYDTKGNNYKRIENFGELVQKYNFIPKLEIGKDEIVKDIKIEIQDTNPEEKIIKLFIRRKI